MTIIPLHPAVPFDDRLLMGADQINGWADEVRFPIRDLHQRLRSLRQAETGPKFVRSGSARNAPPIYRASDIWGYFLSGGREHAHDWDA